MTVWYKAGVSGDLQTVAQKGLGKVATLYPELHVTSIREGNHMPGSLHYIGLAFDLSLRYEKLDVDDIKQVLGKGWDVIKEADHVHCEYDPK